jgi:ADP-ribose pyrophosphatase YjhB (NUDIX family)
MRYPTSTDQTTRSRQQGTLSPKFCPHCAGRLVPRTIDQRVRRVCQECNFVFYITPKVAAGALIEEDGRVVLVRRGVEPRAGYWALPSGFAEYGETIEETAIRECHEETGLEVELDCLLGVYSVNSNFYGHLLLILYSAHVAGGELAAGDDAVEARLFAPAELPPDIAFQAHGQALQDWREAVASALVAKQDEEIVR